MQCIQVEDEEHFALFCSKYKYIGLRIILLNKLNLKIPVLKVNTNECFKLFYDDEPQQFCWYSLFIRIPSIICTYVRLSIFLFRMITWVNINGSITKLGMCIDIMDIWFGIANGQISSIFYGVSAWDMPIFSFLDDNLGK